MAAVLACGDGAALSHQTAAAAWDLRRAGTTIHVTIPGRAGRKAPQGVRLHRSPTLTAAQVGHFRGIPVTTVARTIIDLSRTLSEDDLETLVDRADDRGLVDFRDLRAARSASLRAVLRAYDPAPTRSALERRFLKLCRDHDIPRPEVNAYIEGYLVDFVWRDRKLIVEVDGYEHHRSRSSFESDRERDVVLSTRGWRRDALHVAAARDARGLGGGRRANRRAGVRGVVQTRAGRFAGETPTCRESRRCNGCSGRWWWWLRF